MPFFQKKKPAGPLTADEALHKMEQFCAHRDRCSQEVRQRMRELKLDNETADQIFQTLEGDGYVDDRRFARMFAIGKFRQNGWGRVRIRQELGSRALPAALVDEALAEISEEDYRAALHDYLKKKTEQLASEPDAWPKLAASAARRGFETGLIFVTLKRLKISEEE